MASSGSWYTNFGGGHYQLTLSWSASQSVSGNYSDISAKLYITCFGGWSISANATKYGNITIDGDQIDFTTVIGSVSAGNTPKMCIRDRYNIERGVYYNSDLGTEVFEVRTPDGVKHIASVYPDVDTKKNYTGEYDLYFDPRRQASGLRDLLTATFLIWDENLDEAGAREKVKELIDSYSEDEYSKIVECGEMRVVICPDGSTSHVWIYKASRYGFPEVNKEEYEPITPELYDIELNAGTKVVAEGEISLSLIHISRRSRNAGTGGLNLRQVLWKP